MTDSTTPKLRYAKCHTTKELGSGAQQPSNSPGADLAALQLSRRTGRRAQPQNNPLHCPHQLLLVQLAADLRRQDIPTPWIRYLEEAPPCSTTAHAARLTPETSRANKRTPRSSLRDLPPSFTNRGKSKTYAQRSWCGKTSCIGDSACALASSRIADAPRKGGAGAQ